MGIVAPDSNICALPYVGIDSIATNAWYDVLLTTYWITHFFFFLRIDYRLNTKKGKKWKNQIWGSFNKGLA